MVKVSLLISIFTLLGIQAHASYSCEIKVRAAVDERALRTNGAEINSRQEQINNVLSVQNCIQKAKTLLDTRCNEYSFYVADAIITYAHSNSPQYQTKGLLRGNCIKRNLVSVLNKEHIGFQEVERYGFTEKK